MGEYTKTDWSYGDKIGASLLDNMEDGIEYANESLISYGSGSPSGGQNNDLYFDDENNAIYFREGGSWTEVQTFIDRDIGQGLRFNASEQIEVGIGNGLDFDDADWLEVDPSEFAGLGVDSTGGHMRLDQIQTGSVTNLTSGNSSSIEVQDGGPFYVAFYVAHDDTSGDAEVSYTQLHRDGDTYPRIKFTNDGTAQCDIQYSVFRAHL